MPAVLFLSLDDVLELHAEQIDLYGGEKGVHDLGLLQSAVAMPMVQVFGQYAHTDISAMAAAYLFHIAKNHPFNDGNKRTAGICADVFLLVNGFKLTLDAGAYADLVVSVVVNTTSKEQLVESIRKNLLRADVIAEANDHPAEQTDPVREASGRESPDV